MSLNALDIFFVIATLISLAGNLYQYVDRKRTFEPMKSALLALFNDIKGKATAVYQTQTQLINPQNPHKEIATLRWEYAAFCNNTINTLRGFQETVVGVLVSLDPTDREGRAAFRASNYGLTAQEKQLHEEQGKRLLAATLSGFQSKNAASVARDNSHTEPE